MGGRLFELRCDARGEAGVAAAALALMAWPRSKDDVRRLNWQGRITRALHMIDAFPSGAVEPSDPLANEATAALRLFRNDARLNNAIRRSLHLGHMAMPWLKSANTGDTELLPGMTELAKASLQRALADARGDKQPLDPSNFNRSQWDPWLPAVHLAAAMRIVMQGGEKIGEELDYLNILRDRRLLDWWLAEAETIERAATEAFPEIADTIVRVRLA